MTILQGCHAKPFCARLVSLPWLTERRVVKNKAAFKGVVYKKEACKEEAL